ncbi:pseudouridine synthase [Egicoccus halophilus]|uniref:Pseudouridine synthase n=1 Tax=Egicoccus halophilus TaxID=1670830 RepID=A0A8J3ACA8_9ACTN|nr:pseudouridine synthase [Egicoccus halophilus]GGI04895.1 pseudouridine synthase [Egicoccus halophilus]
MTEQRVQKVLAAAGIASRRACEELIATGRVRVNGEVVELGAKCDPTADVVEVDGERINTDPDKLYVLLNKPRGVVTTADDPQGRPTVVDLVNLPQRLYPVGRLDQDTEGLLLLTNDGELTHQLLHPSFEVPRTYVALVPGPVRKRALAQLRDGVELDDGVARARSVRVLEEEHGRALIELVMTEGRKREVRRMFAALGLTVERLARVAYAGVELGELRQGKWRFLTQAEVGRLHAAVAEGSRPAPGGQRWETRRTTRGERDARAANAARATRRGGSR